MTRAELRESVVDARSARALALLGVIAPMIVGAAGCKMINPAYADSLHGSSGTFDDETSVDASESSGDADTSTTTATVTTSAGTGGGQTSELTSAGVTTSTTSVGVTETEGETSESSGTTSEPVECQDEPPALGIDGVELAADFAELYTVYDLGPIPGLEEQALLGGSAVRFDDPNRLLIAADASEASGSIYEIGLQRGPCGNIIGWSGTAVQFAKAPHVDANLVYGTGGVLLFTVWPNNQIAQILPGQPEMLDQTSMGPLGVDQNDVDDGVSGLGFVPPGLAGAGGLRTLSWEGSAWYRVDYQFDGQLYKFTAATPAVTLETGGASFVYAPAGSPGFEGQHVLIGEYSNDAVAAYAVDEQGDPIIETRVDFLSLFVAPSGAHIEPVKGDLLLSTWGKASDRVYVVQGFAPPP